MDKPIDLTPFVSPVHAAGADAERLWRMRGASTEPATAAPPLASVALERQRLANEVTLRSIRDCLDRSHAELRREQLWAGWRRRRPLAPPPEAA